MSGLFTGLDTWAAQATSGLDASARRTLARSIAQVLRRAHQQRIASQVDPGGNPFAPRRPQKIRGKAGRIKRGTMFAKLRQSRYLRARADESSAAIEFLGRVGRIARVHQEGLEDEVTPGGKRVRYARRQLLGLAPADRELIADQVMAALARRDV